MDEQVFPQAALQKPPLGRKQGCARHIHQREERIGFSRPRRVFPAITVTKALLEDVKMGGRPRWAQTWLRLPGPLHWDLLVC